MGVVSYSQVREKKVSLIRQELVDLTRDSQVAVVLNQLLYWCQRVKDFSLFLEEEKLVTPENNCPMAFGWMYKTADELIEETLLTITRPTMRKYLRILVDEGWIEEKRNPDKKWDRTTFMRLNLKKLHNDLFELGHEVPGFEKGLFGDYEQLKNLTSKEENLTDQERNLTSGEENLTPLETSLDHKLKNLTSEERNLTSKLRNLTNQEKNLTSKLRNLTAYTYTETTQKNTNIDHTQKTCARENFSNSKNELVAESGFNESLPSEFPSDNSGTPVSGAGRSGTDTSGTDKSVGEEMICLWEQYVLQKLFPLNWQNVLKRTDARKDQLSSLLAFHFSNDIRLWERFCVRVKASNFMMGGGPNGWKVTLDWILDDGNFRKVLEGNYDNSARSSSQELQDCSYLDNMKPNPVKDAEKAAIIASIKDPVWRNWCTQLAIGVRLNERRMLHEPLSISELRDIADAWFLECEDGRLVWVGSNDPSVLRKIDGIRLNISWVFAKEYPKASTFRTRLVSSLLPISNPQSSTQGENNV